MHGNTRYLILAAGYAQRWNNFLGITKHFLKLNGEVLLERTVNQLVSRIHESSKVYVIGPDDSYDIPGSTLYIPPHKDITNTQVDKFLSSRELWNEKGDTVFLWGDVWWSEYAISSLVQYDKDDWCVWYRPGASITTGCSGGELFAHRFPSRFISAEEAACQRVVDLFHKELIPWVDTGGWSHYRAMLGLPDEHVHGWHDGRNAILIDDWTDDFDYPSDYWRWYGAYTSGRYRVKAEPWSFNLPASDNPEATLIWENSEAVDKNLLRCAAAHAIEHNIVVIFNGNTMSMVPNGIKYDNPESMQTVGFS